MLRNKYLKVIIYVIVVILFWNLLDYVYHTFITKVPYQFEAFDLLTPGGLGIISAYLFFLRDNN